MIMDDSKSADTSELISSFGSPTNYLNNSNNKLSSIMGSRRQSLNKLEAQKKKRRSSISMLNEMMMTEIKELKDENGKKNESSESKSFSSRTSESQNNSSLIKNSKSSVYNSKFNSTIKKPTFKGKSSNSENSYSENLGLLSRNKNTILGVNFITDNKATKKRNDVHL